MQFKDGTSKIVTDQDFRTLTSSQVQTRDWTGKTVFTMTPLTSAGAAIAPPPEAPSSFKRRIRKKTKPEQIEQSSASLPSKALDVPASNPASEVIESRGPRVE